MFGFTSSRSPSPAQEFPATVGSGPLSDIVTPREERLKIKFQRTHNVLIIKGKSTTLEVMPTYITLIEKVKRHFLKSQRLVCYLQFEVINATTTKLLFNLFSVFRKADRAGKDVVVYWMVDEENDDLMDIGLDFQEFYSKFFIITN